MRIHTDVLEMRDIWTAALHAGVIEHGLTQHGSRSRNRAFNLYLEGSGRHGGQWGHHGEKSATWDEWGIFLARLYLRDPNMRIAGVYENAEHFHWVTGNRFVSLTPDLQHLKHAWKSNGRSATGSYYTFECPKCAALLRRLDSAWTWGTFSAATR